jgi:hypothetical protein
MVFSHRYAKFRSVEKLENNSFMRQRQSVYIFDTEFRPDISQGNCSLIVSVAGDS